ncbi:MAG: peptidyl-prolyl cis-trans isomerase [Deltaproteobacteria bacterium]|nr:peptidyl-prolyl cis-trans isomerase [Deltaproteobacteria bacterium]
MESRPGRAAILLVPALLAAGCGREERRAAEPAGPAAATVGGRPVPVEWVATAAAQSGGDVDAGLRRAVEVAALGRLARERGEERARWFDRERRALLVRRLLRREVAIREPPSPRDLDDLRASYERIRSWFVRPEIRTVEHLVVVVTDPQAGPAEGEPAAWEAARRAVTDLAPLARGAESAGAFGALRPLLEARLQREWAAAGLDEARRPQVRLEHIDPFDREGPFDEAFLAAAFALPEAGAVSGPVRTAFGWHLLYLVETLPPRNASFEEAVPEMLERGRSAMEARRAEALGNATRERHPVRARPELLPLTMGGTGAARP